MRGKLVLRVVVGGLCTLISHCAWASKNEMPASREFTQQKEIIHSFRESFGYIHQAEDDSITLYGDSLVAELENAGRYNDYFELKRIVIHSRLLRGESRAAIAHSDLMYSKAKALRHDYGLALSLNAIGEVYSYTDRLEESNNALKESLKLLKDPTGNKVLTKMILVKLVDNCLHLKDKKEADRCLQQLNKYPKEEASIPEQGLLLNYNAYYSLQNGEADKAHEYLQRAWGMLPRLPEGIVQHLLVTEASYYISKEEYEKALETFDRFFKTKRPERNSGLYVDVMRNKADLFVKMGRKKEAFNLYAEIHSYINSLFKKSYPKELDELRTRFQADRLTYQNERSRSLSIRFFAIGIGVCVIVLVYFLFLGWKKIFRLRQSKKKQEEMREKAESAIRKKNLFLSNMSHEVRTPLNAIVGFSTLLASEEDMGMDEEARKEAANIIRVNSQQLLKLINDILDLSDFEEENFHFHIKEHDAVKICNDVVETVRASYNLEVELRLETKLSSLMLETDDSRLRQVLINLLVNATKFTKEGSIILKLETEDEQTALFSVTDTGCGIPSDKQKKIFERFEKLDEFVQGTGLGLSICQLIVKHVGGRIWIDEQYVHGARFCFTHPLRHKPDRS